MVVVFYRFVYIYIYIYIMSVLHFVESCSMLRYLDIILLAKERKEVTLNAMSIYF